MPLSWNEIRSRAMAFSKEWADETSENAESKTFWDNFFNVFGITRRRLASFEAPVKQRRDGGQLSTGRIDLFWRGVLLVEHKSRGRDLDRAYTQAIDYFPGIPERDLPRYILVSDFARLRLYDLETGERWEFPLADLHKQVRLFGFIVGYQVQAPRLQDPVNFKAAERMGQLHDRLKASGYIDHPLEVLLVRVLFCLFADNTGLFQPAQAFREWLEQETQNDGRDLGPKLTELFQVLNTPPESRQKNLDERLAAFPYVNGRLFAEMLPIPTFDAVMRTELLDACALDWSRISPAIFGGLFQSIMDPIARRNLGAHYTSETNILKLIGPLFLENLHREFTAARGNAKKLEGLQRKLRALVLFDPACGCGNFLVVAYRELRLLELAILRVLANTGKQTHMDVTNLIYVNVDQCYGIEMEEFPAQIARVALWLTDHQMNQQVSEEFGQYFARLPLTTSASITHGNALTLDWETVVSHERVSYILGNPPFVGKKEQNRNQKAELLAIMHGVRGASVLDYVTAWYRKAAEFMQGTNIRAAFVSTNSIAQGEQPGILWPQLWTKGMKIHFAHHTFKWSNEGRGKAAVHCVIIGFGPTEPERRVIYDYARVDGDPHLVEAHNINHYLVDAVDVVITKRSCPLTLSTPSINYGSMPIDDGHLILSMEERNVAIASEPQITPFIRPYAGGEEFLNNTQRWCLWLSDTPLALQRHSPLLRERIGRVRAFREASGRAETIALAATPALFGEIRQPASRYLLIAKVSSESRPIMPIGFMAPTVIASGSCLIVPGATNYHFGTLQSTMHMAWMRAVAGRMKSDYQYSASIVYNNFPWPDKPTDRQRAAIETAAQSILDARTQFPEDSLADLYDPLAMPRVLMQAHQTLDRAVDAAYGRRAFTSDAERVAFLFDRYQQLTSLLPPDRTAKKRRVRRDP